MKQLVFIAATFLLLFATQANAATETELETTGLEVSDASSVPVVIDLDDEAEKIGLSKDMIEARVNAVLRRNGLKPLEGKPAVRDYFYYVQVGLSGNASVINVCFSRRVTFNDGIRERHTLADTWKRGIRLGLGDIGSDPSKITDSIVDEVSRSTEVFANEFLKANRK